MFGEEDQAQQPQGSSDQPATDTTSASSDASAPSENVVAPTISDTSTDAPAADSPADDSSAAATPAADEDTGNWSDTPSSATPADDEPEDKPAEDSSSDDSAAPAPTSNGDANALLDIKQQALQELTPLMGHLDQTPEEEFRTTMMMIQASDNQDLVKKAYDAAMAITDDKVKALALLDIVNEINYFTQSPDQPEK